MAPLRIFPDWDKRPSDKIKEQIEPYKRYFLICEGENTEKWYFEALIDNKKALNIKSNIELKYVERTEEDLHNSNPIKLLEYADSIVNDKSSGYESGDGIILVFDVDIYIPDREDELKNIINQATSKGYTIGVTNPSFELFLLLHVPNSYNTHILLNKAKILQKKKGKGKQSFVQKLVTKCTGMNPKKNKNIGQLSTAIDVAIEQEKNVNQDLSNCTKDLTCNIGSIIAKIREEEL